VFYLNNTKREREGNIWVFKMVNGDTFQKERERVRKIKPSHKEKLKAGRAGFKNTSKPQAPPAENACN